MAVTTAVAIKATPTFLGVPGEIREKIILEVVRLEKGDRATAVDDATAPQKYDFSVNAFGVRCHSMESFNLMFVNKQIHFESIAVLYKHSSVVLYAEVTHDARAFGFIPKMLNNIPPAMKVGVQKVGVKFLNVALVHVSSLSPNQNIPQEKAGRRNLTAVVNTVINDFVQRKTLHISAGINGVKLDDLKALFELLAIKDNLIILEEIWQVDGVTYRPAWYHLGNFRRADNTGKRILYEDLALKAAAAIGQEWFQKAKAPTLVENTLAMVNTATNMYLNPVNTTPPTFWCGSHLRFARRRVWKREYTATPTPEMTEYLKERVYPSSSGSKSES
ncbi:hypothetical protein BKA61DRAFT_729262 [Leptodontidium sp. MPI-SDFR-AT-0119]|nr:hypothetical protein BKA61DRAFT_729262 [Leptodontidium sp. MPI-SDFR-AT-0119]